MAASDTVSLMTLLIVVSLLLLSTIYFYHSRKNKPKATPPSLTRRDKEKSSTASSINRETSIETPWPTPFPTKSTLPYTTRKPFKETVNVTVDDFYNFRGARLLIVEDNKINQKIFQSILQKSGIHLTIANHGQEALEYLYTPDRAFDLVMMDINMPVMDGYDCTEKIRADHRFDMLPIITFTAYALGKEIERMYVLGANGHMTKPLNSGQLYTVFNTYLSHIQRAVSTLSALKIEGLDVEAGIAMHKGDEVLYKQILRDFIALHGTLGKQMSQLIEKREYDKIKLYCVKLGSKLHSLGAYEMEEAVTRMKKFFIYGTEHRIDEFKEVFPEKLNRLIITMRLYLQGDLH